MPGSIHLFKITGTLTYENVKLKRYKIWYIIEIDWKKVNMTLNGNKINLPKAVTIMLREELKMRCLIKREPLLFHVILMVVLVMFVHILSLYFINCLHIVSLHATWGRVKLKAKTERRHKCVEL